MKIGALLLAASMLAGCATTPISNGAAMNAGQPRTDAQDATGKVKIDKCMWIKPRCRSR